MLKSDKKTVKLYFTLPKGLSWAEVRKSPAFVYSVRIQNELQVEGERRAEAQRGEDARREKIEAERVRVARLTAEATRERERLAALQKVEKRALEIAGATVSWEMGVVTAAYTKGDFLIVYNPIQTSLYPQPTQSVTNLKKLERALWDAYWAPGVPRIIYQIPVDSAPAGITAIPAPPPAKTATVNCLALLDRGTEGYEKCEKERRLQYGKDVVEGFQKVAEPAAAILEAANPLDPVGLAAAVFVPFAVGRGLRVVGVVVRGGKTRQIIEWVSRRSASRGRVVRFEGDLGAFEASQVGHHVYQYHDKEGKLLYVGKSGGGLGPKDPAAAANSWIDRLEDDHILTDWIGEARSVTVSFRLSEQEMWALEDVLIPTARNNIRPGDYYNYFRGGNSSVNAASALKQPQARFLFEAIPIQVVR